MLPYDLKMDKDGLLYLDDKRILKQNSLILSLDINENKYNQIGFYRLHNTSDYIVKYSYNPFSKHDIEKIKEMLTIFANKQILIPNIDFPIGYFSSHRKLSGLIIKYYSNGISCNNIISNGDIEGLGKYYYHDEDSIRNLFLLFSEVLEDIYEMFENGIYYTDIHPGNVILFNNETKIIDFEPGYIYFNNKDKILKSIMYGYKYFLEGVLEKYRLLDNINIDFNSFEEAKAYTKKLENQVRTYR